MFSYKDGFRGVSASRSQRAAVVSSVSTVFSGATALHSVAILPPVSVDDLLLSVPVLIPFPTTEAATVLCGSFCPFGLVGVKHCVLNFVVVMGGRTKLYAI